MKYLKGTCQDGGVMDCDAKCQVIDPEGKNICMSHGDMQKLRYLSAKDVLFPNRTDCLKFVKELDNGTDIYGKYVGETLTEDTGTKDYWQTRMNETADQVVKWYMPSQPGDSSGGQGGSSSNDPSNQPVPTPSGSGDGGSVVPSGSDTKSGGLFGSREPLTQWYKRQRSWVLPLIIIIIVAILFIIANKTFLNMVSTSRLEVVEEEEEEQ